MSVLDSLANNYALLVSNSPNARPIAWASTALKSAAYSNCFKKFEGAEGSDAPVLRKDDVTKGRGDKIVFTILAPLGGSGRLGSQVLVGYEEPAKINTFQLQIDIRRHATGTDEKFDMISSIKLEGMHAALLGDHCGWVQEWDMMMILRKKATINIVRPNNKGNRESLRSADVISPSMIDVARETAKTYGAKPFKMSKAKAGYPLNNFLFVSPHPALTQFEETPQYLQAVNYAAERGPGNAIFTGEYPNWKGCVIYPHDTIDHDGYGPIGSAFAPKARLGNAIASGTAALTITGGGSATAAAVTPAPNYFQGFSDYDYQWVEGQTAAPDSTNRYVLIYNFVDSGTTNNGTGGTGGAPITDVGLWGFYQYNTNNGNTLTTSAYQATNTESGTAGGGRLSATANGGGGDTRHTKVGNVTFSNTVNCENHPSGATIVETNSYGVPIGFSVMLGAEAVFRGYGKKPMSPINNNQDYDFKHNNGYITMYGQTIFVDTDGNPKRYVLVEHAIQYAGMQLPTV